MCQAVPLSWALFAWLGAVGVARSQQGDIMNTKCWAKSYAEWRCRYTLGTSLSHQGQVCDGWLWNWKKGSVCWTRSMVFASINVWRCSKQYFRLTCILVNRVCLQSNVVGSLVVFPYFGGEISVFHPLERWRGFQHSSLLRHSTWRCYIRKPKRSQKEM